MDPADPDLCLCTALRQATRRVSQHYDGALDALGVSANQFSILRQLERAGGATIRALAADLVMDRSTLGRLLRPLEQRSFVLLTAPAADRRRREIRLTAAGIALVDEARPLWRAAQEAFETAFGAASADTLRQDLRRICQTQPGASRRPAPLRRS